MNDLRGQLTALPNVKSNEELMKEANEEIEKEFLLYGTDFPKFKHSIPMAPDEHCDDCIKREGEWYHKCPKCEISYKTRLGFSRNRSRNVHQSWCRGCAKKSGKESFQRKGAAKKSPKGIVGRIVNASKLLSGIKRRHLDIAILSHENELVKLDVRMDMMKEELKKMKRLRRGIAE